MTIGKIKTEADLERFIQERLESIPITAIDGLSEMLAALGAQTFNADEDTELEAEFIPVAGCEYTVPSDGLFFAVIFCDFEGPGGSYAIGRVAVNGAPAGPQAAISSASGRGVVGQCYPFIGKTGDTVRLEAKQTGAGYIWRGTHTTLSIVRFR